MITEKNMKHTKKRNWRHIKKSCRIYNLLLFVKRSHLKTHLTVHIYPKLKKYGLYNFKSSIFNFFLWRTPLLKKTCLIKYSRDEEKFLKLHSSLRFPQKCIAFWIVQSNNALRLIRRETPTLSDYSWRNFENWNFFW